MSPQALGTNAFALMSSNNNNFINYIQSTFLFIQRLNVGSGVFKGRRARHLPWLFGGPLEVLCADIIFVFGEKLIIHSYNVLQSRS